jgi:hypothetical protein
MQSLSDDCDRTRFTLETKKHVKSTGSQHAQELGRIFKANRAFLWECCPIGLELIFDVVKTRIHIVMAVCRPCIDLTAAKRF